MNKAIENYAKASRVRKEMFCKSPNCGFVIEFIEVYIKICMEAIKQNGFGLEYIKYNRFSKEEYERICMKAIEQNGMALRCVKYDIFSKEEYKKMCIKAIKQNSFALEHLIYNI